MRSRVAGCGEAMVCTTMPASTGCTQAGTSRSSVRWPASVRRPSATTHTRHTPTGLMCSR